MKFKEFLKENIKPSIDDNIVLTNLDNLGIFYNRIKKDNGNFLYQFDNRYSLEYDGATFILYRHENIIHYGNARNDQEVTKSIDDWNEAYNLATVEIDDEKIDDIVQQMKKDSQDQESDNSDEITDDEKDETEPDDENNTLEKEEEDETEPDEEKNKK